MHHMHVIGREANTTDTTETELKRKQHHEDDDQHCYADIIGMVITPLPITRMPAPPTLASLYRLPLSDVVRMSLPIIDTVIDFSTQQNPYQTITAPRLFQKMAPLMAAPRPSSVDKGRFRVVVSLPSEEVVVRIPLRHRRGTRADGTSYKAILLGTDAVGVVVKGVLFFWPW